MLMLNYNIIIFNITSYKMRFDFISYYNLNEELK